MAHLDERGPVCAMHEGLRIKGEHGQYVLKRCIGQSCGWVWLCTDEHNGKFVVLKFVSLRQPPSAGYVVGGSAPASALPELALPERAAACVETKDGDCMPKFHEVFFVCGLQPLVPNGVLAGLVMEYIEGFNLAEVIAMAIIPEGVASVILRQLCFALRCIHASEIVHGDLQPENILVGIDGRVRLCDFQCVNQPVDFGSTDTELHFGPGLQQVLHPSTSAMDIWSFGIVAFSLLEGGPPRTGTVQASLPEQTRAFTSMKPSFSQPRSLAAEELVSACLCQDAERRLSAATLLEMDFLGEMHEGQALLAEFMADLRRDNEVPEAADLPRIVDNLRSPLDRGVATCYSKDECTQHAHFTFG